MQLKFVGVGVKNSCGHDNLKSFSCIPGHSMYLCQICRSHASTGHIHAALYVTHRQRRATINFTMFLTIFEYAELMPSGAKHYYY